MSRVEGKVESKVEGHKMSLQVTIVRKKQKSVLLEHFFVCAQKMDHNNNTVRAFKAVASVP